MNLCVENTNRYYFKFLQTFNEIEKVELRYQQAKDDIEFHIKMIRNP